MIIHCTAERRGRSRARACATSICSILLLALVSSMAAPRAGAAPEAPLGDLPGRWSGWGAVTLGSGRSEQVKCIATYFLKDEGASLLQNLRCASSSYRIDAVATLAIMGEHVSGHWEERNNQAAGSVSGRLTRSGFNLSIQGESFTAAMTVATSHCKQSINIAPQGIDIRRIAIGLDRC